MQGRLWKSYFIILTVFAAVLLFFAPSWGAWVVSPRIEILEEYNDNILFSRQGEELDDWVTYVRPRLEGVYGIEKFHVSLDSGIGIERYVDNTDLNTTDHDHRCALSWALSKTLGLNAGGYFRQDTTLETELSEEGLLARREDRRKFGGNLGLTYVFSTRFSLSGEWTRTYSEYPDDPDYYDNLRGDTLNLSPQYVLSPRTKLFLEMVYTNTQYDAQEEPSIVNYSIAPSFRHDFAEDSYVSGAAGYRHTKQETATLDEDTNGLVFKLSFHRNWKKASMALLASRNQYATIDRRSVERDRLTLRGTYRLGVRLSTTVAATFRRNRVEDGNNYDYYAVSPSLTYDLTPSMVLRAFADYSEYGYKDDSARDRERFTARLSLDFVWPRLFSGE